MGRLEEENDDDIVFVGEDLTWRDVAHVSGAYEPSYLTRSRVQNDGVGPSGIDKGKALESRQRSGFRLVDEEVEKDIGSDCGGDDVVQVDDDDDHFTYF
uniref:Uncharacterized protein n=1 Tax=Lactuca sativa TaxID=4236 RepID=A0A9R1VUJ2_LACSA|nr:hypothetical protein LSAT_V11C400161250 [Lactuca sativa]